MESGKIDKKQNEKSSKLPYFLTAGLLLLLVGLYFLWPAFGETTREAWKVLQTGEQQKISAWVKQFGFWGPFFIILFMVVQMFLFVVNVVALIVIAVLAYGPIWGSLLALTGIITASIIGYMIGRSLGCSAVSKFVGKKSVEKFEKQVDRFGVWAIIAVRISPFLSDDAVSFVAGVARMPFLKFMFATVIGVFPLIALIAYLGEDIDKLKTGLIWVSVISIIAFLIYYFYDRRKNPEFHK